MSPFPNNGPSPRPLIAVIEDNPPDVFLVQEALSKHGFEADIKALRDGESALEYIKSLDKDEASPCPALFLLDLNIPARTGEELLGDIRGSKRCSATPVVIITSSNSPRDRQATESLGANYYFSKPCDYDGFMKLGEIVQRILKV